MWDLLVINPMINGLLWLYDLLGNNFFLAIAVFTVVLRVATLPTQLRQQRTSIKMQAIQPQVQAIQKKYKDNPQKMQEEFRKIGYNPMESLSGCLPLLLQMPILIGLYRAILIVLGSTPQSTLELTQRVYSFIDLPALLPITNKVGWLNLAQPDPLLIMPILVFATSFLSQKVLSPAPQQSKSKNGKNDENPMAGAMQSMQYTMPIMFGIFALQFPAGLSIYWVLTSLIGFVLGLYTRRQMDNAPAKTVASAPETLPEGESVALARNGSQDYKRPAKQRSQSKRKRRSAKR